MIISKKLVTFNDQIISDQSSKLKKIGEIKVFFPPIQETQIKPQKLDLNILYEDDSLIVVNKKAGMVVHPAAGNFENTLVNALLFHCKKSLSGIGGYIRPGIVHRLDKMTSGIIVIAKNDLTHIKLSNQFKDRTISREYRAIAWNKLKKINGTIEKNIGRSTNNRKKMSTNEEGKGKNATTYYKLSNAFNINKDISLSEVKCKLLTGRTHQIRVHLLHIGNPLVGDNVYKKNINYNKIPKHIFNFINENFIKIERHALHAQNLGFFHPEKKKELFFTSKLPKDLDQLTKVLKKYKKTAE